ncbi:MAG: DUF5777 family beta-barrel protein [Gemmatimonadota bacterium]|nr:DUF5777 family beta-barrel protein [Gemmatimonadota bacterium]
MTRRLPVFSVLLFALWSPVSGAGQVFQSSHAANLPTATTVPQGDLLFEISHRFTPRVADGAGALWGLDGPVINRLGLAYAVSDRAMVGVTRSNLEDNLELGVQGRLWRGGSEELPLALGGKGAVAWNTSPALVQGAEDNEAQLYAQLVLDAGLGERAAVGLVPTYLRNPRIRDVEADDAFVLGLHGHVALTANVNILGEWIVSEARRGQQFDTGTFGVELRTRGHFFKVVLTNQIRMNQSQVLGGSAAEFTPDEWRLGFNITRRLAF